MRRSSFLYGTLLVMVILLTAHLAGSYLSLYWTEWWYDYMMHFLGGVAVGLFAIWIFWTRIRSGRTALVASIVLVLVAGVAWEVFEHFFDIARSTESYKLDTIHDLVSDVLGAAIASLGFRNLNHHG